MLVKSRLLSPFVSEKYWSRIARSVQELPWFNKKAPEAICNEENSSTTGNEFSKIKVSEANWYKKEPSVVEVESIYKTLPNAKTAVIRDTPEPRYIWKESQKFPSTPEEADVDVMTYLEQKDCYNRLQKLKVRDFCVGSIVAVTRADPYIPKGKVRFVGICIAKNHWQNTLGATFTLRNVIDGEPMEVNFQLYSPSIQKIEVLKHERRDKPALWYLRDYPPNFSYVKENMKEHPYTQEPSLYVKTKEERLKLGKWFDQIWKKKKLK